MGFRDCLERAVDSNFLAQALQTLYQPLSFFTFNVWCQKKGGKSRVKGRLENHKRKYGQMEGNRVLEMNTLGFKFQFCSLLALCIYSTSLSLSSLLRKIRLIYRVALRSKYFIESVQFSVNGAAIIMIMMTDIKGVILCLPPMIWTSLFSLYFQCFLHFLPSSLHS